MNLWDYYCYPHFTVEKTMAQRLNDLSKNTQIGNSSVRISRRLYFEAHAFLIMIY